MCAFININEYKLVLRQVLVGPFLRAKREFVCTKSSRVQDAAPTAAA